VGTASGNAKLSSLITWIRTNTHSG
jgi:hypothetical protein